MLFKERVHCGVALGRGVVRFAGSEGHSTLKAEQPVHGYRVLQSTPGARAIHSTAGDQKGARCHKGVKLHQIVPLFYQMAVGSGAGLLVGLLTKKPLESILVGGILGYLYGDQRSRNQEARNVVLEPGTEFGVRLDQNARLRA